MGEGQLTDAPLPSGSEVAAGGKNRDPGAGSGGGGGGEGGGDNRRDGVGVAALVLAVVVNLVVTSTLFPVLLLESTKLLAVSFSSGKTTCGAPP